MPTLRAKLDRWGYVGGSTVNCDVELACNRGRCEPVLVDWLAVQCCGFVRRVAEDGSVVQSTSSTLLGESSTSLHDETRVRDDTRACVLASQPRVVAAALTLEPRQVSPFGVSVTLPTELPPSFAGSCVCYEYLLIFTLRVMKPPSGWPGSSWTRGPIHQLRVPVRLVATGASAAALTATAELAAAAFEASLPPSPSASSFSPSRLASLSMGLQLSPSAAPAGRGHRHPPSLRPRPPPWKCEVAVHDAAASGRCGPLGGERRGGALVRGAPHSPVRSAVGAGHEARRSETGRAVQNDSDSDGSGRSGRSDGSDGSDDCSEGVGMAEENVEEDSGEEGGDAAMVTDDGMAEPAWRRFVVRTDSADVCALSVSTTRVCVGGVIRGQLEMRSARAAAGRPAMTCQRVSVTLELMEAVPPNAPAPVASATRRSASHATLRHEMFTSHLDLATFELTMPHHVSRSPCHAWAAAAAPPAPLRPATALPPPDARARPPLHGSQWPPELRTEELSVTWALAFRFELAPASSGDSPRLLDWRLPVHVYAAPDAALPPPLERPAREVMHAADDF